MIKGFNKVPFVKHDKIRKSITANIPFFNGGFYYQELEKGFWVICSKIKYKANVCYEIVNDGKTPNEFYFLSLNIMESKPCVYKDFSNKPFTLPRFSWSFQKPYSNIPIKYGDINHKGTTNRFIVCYFTEEWFQKHLTHNTLFAESQFGNFIQSEQRFLYSTFYDEAYANKQLQKFDEFFGINQSDANHKGNNLLGLKMQSLSLIADFLTHCKTEKLVASHYILDDQEQENILEVERYLNENLMHKFPSIEVLAKKFNISESKLKTDFKQVFGKPLYQYFQHQQMQVAKELVSEKKFMIKEIAYKFGYENPDKFSAAFKKHHKMLPSEV